ncbi:magnesium transporter CorA family protein [Jatrophihabitans sp. YIM 134969]
MTTDTVDPVAHEENRDPGVRTRVWKDGQVVDHHFSIERVSDHLEMPGKLVWVDLTSPDHAMLAKLAEEISLDPNSVEDAVAADERPKVTGYGRYSFVTVYATSLAGDEVETCRISAFVLEKALITVHDGDWRGFEDVVKRWDDLGALIADNGVDVLLYGLLDHVVDGQFDTVQDIEDRIDTLESQLFDGKPETLPERKLQFDLRRSIVALRRVVSPQAQMVSSLHRVRGARHPTMESYWADLDDHVARVVEWTDQARDLLNNVFSSNMSLQDARLNVVMKKLTSWAAIIAVPTAITGFYGQNVKYPDFGTTTGFLISTGIIVVAMGLLYLLFKRKDWL